MFYCCSIAKNTIRFSFSHSLTSLFCFTRFSHNLRGSHFATLSRLRLACTCNLFCLISSFIHSFQISHHPTPTLLTPPLVSLDLSNHSSWFSLFSVSPPSPASLSFFQCFFSSSSPSFLLILSSLPEVVGSANMVVARWSSQDVFLPDGPGQPASTTRSSASPPTYPQSVSPSAHSAEEH